MRGVLGAALASAAALALLPGALRGGGAENSSSPAGLRAVAFRAEAGEAAPAGRRAVPGWHGGTLVAATGEQVTVFVSASYPPEQVPAQRWADFFARLLHGPELASATVRIVTPTELAELCGGGALGCYAQRELVAPGEIVAGVTPEEVATHEYGHHVAASRSNPPWSALTWGTKRWASATGICARVRAGTAFPGDQGDRYRLNPGEGFAESYRILNERRAGVGGSAWGLVDGSFFPNDAALGALALDVTTPWTRPTTRGHRVSFAKGSTRWTLRLNQALDGELVAVLKVPRGRLDTLELRSGDGRKVLARGLWTGTAEKRLSYVVCGERKLLLRVTRQGSAAPTRLIVTAP